MKRVYIFLIGLGVVIVIGAGIYRFAFSHSAKDKVMALLRNHERVLIKNETERINSRDLLKRYYDIFGYSDIWTQAEDKRNKFRDMLNDMLGQADSLGLNPADYHADFIKRYDSLSQQADFDKQQYKEESEVIFSDAAISFLFDVAYGKEIKISYNGVNYHIDTSRVVQAYNRILETGNWRKVLDTLEPKISQYFILKQRLNRMKTFLKDHPELDTLTVSDSHQGRIAATLKLRFYEITDSLSPDSNETSRFKYAIERFQSMMNIDTTGQLDKATLVIFNEPLTRRVNQIKESLNYWRWTGRLAEHEFILVNIPAARLQIVNQDSAQDLSMRVIVGKTGTPTPSFTAYISKVIAYPYWNVPFSIATKEMLPKIKKSISYLEANELQVTNNKGEILNPTTIDWASLSGKHFPYRIRQSTGCDNSLGVLKFDLNSPFSIYLHDTNARSLFARSNRFLSHGCIRVEKPMELANYILEDGLDSATTAKLNQCLKDEKPTEFKLKKNFPVLILYMMADIDAKGNLKFYRDIYGKEVKPTV